MGDKFYSARTPDDERVAQAAASVGHDLESLAEWDALVWAMRGRAPFSTLMDYALGLWAWTWREDHPDNPDEPFEIQTPPLCLIALAGYGIAAAEGIYEADRVPLDAVTVLLADDKQARQLVTIEPGLPHRAEGQLRDNDRQALAAAVQPGSELPWQQWREQAGHAVEGHLSRHSVVTFQTCLSRVRALRVRRGWYDKPKLPPTHASDAPNEERC